MATGQKPTRVDAHLASEGVLKDLSDAAKVMQKVCGELVKEIETSLQQNSKLRNEQNESLQVKNVESPRGPRK